MALKHSSDDDTDLEYEQIRARLDDFENDEVEVEDYEEENYLVCAHFYSFAIFSVCIF